MRHIFVNDQKESEIFFVNQHRIIWPQEGIERSFKKIG